MAYIKVLIVEDEKAQMELLSYNLEKQGYGVLKAFDGEEGLLLAQEEMPDLIILDWMLPGISGIELCRQLKRHDTYKKIPVLMLTARGEESDKIRGLDIGADDFMVKPYSVNELMARSRALLRRFNVAEMNNELVVGDVRMNMDEVRVFRNDVEIILGPTEFRLLTMMAKRPNRVWSRNELLERVWDHNLDIDQRTVDVHIGRLRRALEQKNYPNPIRTIRSVGYALND